jgi:hypothetical protein
MKTNNRLRNLLRMLALCIVVLSGTSVIQAQDRGEGEGHGRGNKHSEYKNDNRGHEQGQRYYRSAPWGWHHPYTLYHNHNRVYYYGGHYYQYYPDRGYLMIEVPGDYYFDGVPAGFRRVWIDGRWCYRRGDLYLRPGVHGYFAFPGPGFSVGVGF